MRKTRIAIVIGMMSLMLSMVAISTMTNEFISGDFWSLKNNDTIVLTNSSHNVNIGENASTGFKLNVNGRLRVNGSSDYYNDLNLINSKGVIYFSPDLAHTFADITNNNNKILKISSTKFLDLLSFYDLNLNATHGKVKTNNVFEIKNTLQTANIINNSFGDDINITASDELILSGKISCTSDLTVSGDIVANSFIGFGTVPIGGIIPWCNHIGSIVLTLPDGYWVCNGSQITDIKSSFYHELSPDLRLKFIRGSNNLTSGSIGGNRTRTLASANLPAHSHPINSGGSGVVKYPIGTTTQALTPTGIGVTVIKTITQSSVTTTDNNIGTTSQAFNIEPPYYDVVYLVRIK